MARRIDAPLLLLLQLLPVLGDYSWFDAGLEEARVDVDDLGTAALATREESGGGPPAESEGAGSNCGGRERHGGGDGVRWGVQTRRFFGATMGREPCRAKLAAIALPAAASG